MRADASRFGPGLRQRSLPFWKGQVEQVGRQAAAANKAVGCQTTLFSFLFMVVSRGRLSQFARDAAKLFGRLCNLLHRRLYSLRPFSCL